MSTSSKAQAADSGKQDPGTAQTGTAHACAPDDGECSSDEHFDSLLDVWHGLSSTRKASCWSWVAFGVTWAIARLITHHGRGGQSAAIDIAGHHVHHYLLGIILLGLTAAAALFIKPERWWSLLGIGYGISLALIMDEYALLLNLSDVYWAKQGRLSVDVVLFFLAAGGAYVTAITWINEAGRRARRRLHKQVQNRLRRAS